MTEPQDPAAASGDQLRAGHADREQVIDTLKTAFVHGRLTKDEFDARAGQALSARTRAELAALTADIPPAPSAAGSARPPAPARRRPLARAAVRSGICLAFAAAAVWAAFILDPGPRAGASGSSWGPGVGWCFVLAIYAVIAAVCIMGVGVAKSKEQRRSRRQPPPRPGPRRPGARSRTARRHRPRPGSPRAPAPTRPAPTCGLTAHGRVGRIPPGGVRGRGAGLRPVPGVRVTGHLRHSASSDLTCVVLANLPPLCRHHHRCMQAQGWQLNQPATRRPDLAHTIRPQIHQRTPTASR